jgi:hypothetical protein
MGYTIHAVTARIYPLQREDSREKHKRDSNTNNSFSSL